MSHASSLKHGRVFIFGAGFSAAAGIPLTNVLLPKAARIFRDETPGLFDRVSNFADDVDVDLGGTPTADDFARLCTHLDFMELREHGGAERWSDQGSRERLALKFFLSKTIARSTPDMSDLPDLYVAFAKNLTPNDVIVTLNWDTLIEKSIIHAGLQYSYTGEEGKIFILKLHGSVSWIAGAPTRMIISAPNFDYSPIGYSGGLVTSEIYSSELLWNKTVWEAAAPLTGEVKPLIVLPGYGKAVDVRLLSALWYRPEFLNIREGGVSLIGLSVAHDDYIVESYFRYLFRSALSPKTRIRVLNPDPNVGDKFRGFGGHAQIDVVCERFSEATLNIALLND